MPDVPCLPELPEEVVPSVYCLRGITMANVFDIPLVTNDLSVDRLLGAGLPVLLVFSSGTPAADLQRELERIARERAGRLLVARAAMRDAPEAARRFAVAGLPAVVAVRDGTTVSAGEGVSAGEVDAHARFLLGEGPRPAARGAAATAGAAADAPGQPVHVTDATFDRVVMRAPVPVLVDFWASWCGPCRMTNPMLERLAREQAGKLVVAKVDIDENPGLAGRWQVQAVPTLMIVRGGEVVERWSGALPEAALRGKVAAVTG
jgi:thioredoxin 1